VVPCRNVNNNGYTGVLTFSTGTELSQVNVTNSEISRNFVGPMPNSHNRGAGICIWAIGGKCKVVYDDVTSRYNNIAANAAGINSACKDIDITMKDVTASNNGNNGWGINVGSDSATINLEGTITSSHQGTGMLVSGFDGVILNVKGNLNLGTNDIGFSPLIEKLDASFSVVVEEGGSFQTCGNEEYDIQTDGEGKGTLTWTGKFICDQTKVDVGATGNAPNCEPCP